MKKVGVRFGLIVVLSILFSTVFFVLRGVLLDEAASGLAAFAMGEAPVENFDFEDAGYPRGRLLQLVAPEGLIDLRHEPCGETVISTEKAGTMVRYLARVSECAATWYLVEKADGTRGWVPAAAVVAVGEEVRFEGFRLVPGTAALPATDAGRAPATSDEAIWIRWNYHHLRPGDAVQYILVIGAERYAGPAILWNGPTNGQQWVNLMTLGPRVEPGNWTVWLMVNGEFAGQHVEAVQ